MAGEADPLVDIVLADGRPATVPQSDLDQALAANARLPTAEESAKAAAEADVGGLAGQAATGIIGAGRSASMGLTDALITEGANVIGGEKLRQRTQGALNQARETNPYANFGGETAGLFLPGGSSVSALGEAAEGAVGSAVGDGLIGKAMSMGARGGLEGALIGTQQGITENALGDPDYNGQAVFASAAKGTLLGGGAGALLGVGSHYLGEGTGLLSRRPGPPSDATLDEIAGVPGAGRALRNDAREAEDFVTKARSAGATSDQAAQMVDDAATLAKARANAGIGSGLIDSLGEKYAGMGGSEELQQLKKTQYEIATKKIVEHEAVLDQSAESMAKKGTEALRKLEDTVNDVQFKSKSEQMAKLVDPTKLDTQADTVAGLLQNADQALGFWEPTMTKGGAEGAIKSVRRALTDAQAALAETATRGSESTSRDLFIKTDKLKQSLDSFSRWGQEFGLPEAVNHPEFGIRAMADKFRGTLEDESVWGKAAAAQKDWNQSFSDALARRQHFGRELGVSIDQQRGVSLPEVDFKKARGMLSELRGNEIDDSLQSVRSTKDFISGLRNRVRAIEEHGELSAAQASKLAEGKKALTDFETSFVDAQKNSAVVNRLKAQQLNEQSKGMGGLLGLIGDVVSKPLTTMDRLGQVRMTVAKVEEGVAGGLRKFFGGSGQELADKIAPRAKDVVTDEIGKIRETAANPAMMQTRIESMVGNLRKVAPKIADSVAATAQRAFIFLSQEAPQASVPIGLMGVHNAKPRYSDQQLHEWETKRRAALDPQSVVDDMQQGKLNREAIRTVEFVSPALFSKMQELAMNQLADEEARGTLDSMPYQQKAAISTLLKVPADGTWKPDFIAMMQAAKLPPVSAQQGGAGGVAQPNQGVSKRAVKMNTDIYSTAAQGIEAGGMA